jgi:hypothetical protein
MTSEQAAQLIDDTLDLVHQRLQELEAAEHQHDQKALAACLVGRKSGKMDFSFEPGEVRDLQVIAQEVRGHCVISTVKVSVVSRFLQEKKEGQIRLIHSMLSEGSPELLFVE